MQAIDDTGYSCERKDSAPNQLCVDDPMPYNKENLLHARQKVLGNCTALFNSHDPLHIVEGQGCWLIDAEGNRYLDCVNNVAHVGHSNPRVSEAVQEQMSKLNTNIRYLNAKVTSLAKMLTDRMGPGLRTEDGAKVYFTTSGSEANDLALRIAFQTAQSKTLPGRHHVAVMDGAYHGHTLGTLALSPYKFKGEGGFRKPDWVHVLPCPNVPRKTNMDGAKAARQAVAEAKACGATIAAFFCESIISCGGQVVLPDGYLQQAYEVFREQGAICIADEVQCGFGRVGLQYWAYHTAGVIPDIVTLAKSMGNGVPMGGVVVREDVATIFDSQGMEYFSTCGGCNLAVAAGIAVLEELEDQELSLIPKAEQNGQTLLENLKKMEERYPFIAQARGVGLMVGIEFWDGPRHKRPASALTKWVQLEMLRRRIILSVDGPSNSVIKIKPPLVIGKDEVLMLSAELDQVFLAVPPLLQSVPEKLSDFADKIASTVDVSTLEGLEASLKELSWNVQLHLGGATDPACVSLLEDCRTKLSQRLYPPVRKNLTIGDLFVRRPGLEAEAAGSGESGTCDVQEGGSRDPTHAGPVSHPLDPIADLVSPHPLGSAASSASALDYPAGLQGTEPRSRRGLLDRQPAKLFRGLMHVLRIRL